jgi:serine/threonine-protein kinase
LTAQWVRDAEQRLELDAKLARVLDGDVEPVNASEQLALAQFCLEWKKFAAMAARLFAAAFVESPTYADPPALHRYNAARAAALAGCGQGKDVANLDYTERIRLRKQALEWLTADLAARAKLAELPAERRNARQTIQHWQEDTDLAGVRGDAIAKLPKAEQAGWQKLWADVAALEKRCEEPPTPKSPPKP